MFVESFKSISTSKDSYLKEWIHHEMSLEKNIDSILQEFKITFRYALCNSSKFLNANEEVSLMTCLGNLLWKAIEDKAASNDPRWSFFCDVFGLNDLTFKSTIAMRQNMGPLQKFTSKLIG